MSLSELFGSDMEDDEEDFRPSANAISDIESGEEMSPVTEAPAPQLFPLGELKPMKPPEFDSDDEIDRSAKRQDRHVLSSEEERVEEVEEDDMTFFRKDRMEVDSSQGPQGPQFTEAEPEAAPEDAADAEGAENAADAENAENAAGDMEGVESVPVEVPVENAEDFFKDSDDDDVQLKSSTKTTANDLFGSDVESDEAQPAASGAGSGNTQSELFGSESDEEKPTKETEEGLEENDNLHRIQRSDGESEEEVGESELAVEMPLVDINLGEDLNLCKLPNFLSIDTRPFDPETYEDEIEDDNEITDDEGRTRLKLKVENTIRWRHGLDDRGNLIKQTNTRFVKWSDGHLSLFVGSEEFDVVQAPLSGELNHLYVKHGAGIQGQAQFQQKMMFRIHSTDSYTHRKMTLRISDRVSKASKIRQLPSVGKDPETRREELCKKEEERLIAQRRRESMARKMREKNMSKNMSASYLEPDDDEGDSIQAIKNSYKEKAKEKKTPKKTKVSDVYSSDEDTPPDESEEEGEAVATDSDSDNEKKKQKRKPAVIEEGSEEEEDD